MIPKKLKIGAHTYKVLVKELDVNFGQVDREKNIISISDKLPQNQQEVTLIHEILHALNNELDHTFLDSLAEQFYQVIKDNKLWK